MRRPIELARDLVETVRTTVGDKVTPTLDPAEVPGLLSAGTHALLIGPPRQEWPTSVQMDLTWEALLVSPFQDDRERAWEGLDTVLIPLSPELTEGDGIDTAEPAEFATNQSQNTYPAYLLGFTSTYLDY